MYYKYTDSQIVASNGKYILNILARLIIRGSQDHALVGPLENQPLMIYFIGGFLFSAKFGPGFVILVGKQGLMEVKGWNYWNLIKITYLCLSKLVFLRILKYSVVILLFSSLIAHTFSRSLVLADYLVNMESYKKNMC
jgi:hypothetical protein